MCESCGNKSNERSKDKLAERQKGNLCTSCGFEKENKDKAYCYVCTEKDNLRLKERRIIRKENDLCTHCGNSKDSASLMCDECNLEYRSHSERLRKEERKMVCAIIVEKKQLTIKVVVLIVILMAALGKV